MAWSAIAVVLHSDQPAKDWGDVPVEEQTPRKQRGDIIGFIADGEFPEPSPTSPYVFIRITGIPDSITLDRINRRLRRCWDELIDYNGGKLWRMHARHRARFDVALLPLAARQALSQRGGNYEGTWAQLLTVCHLKDLNRKVTQADLDGDGE